MKTEEEIKALIKADNNGYLSLNTNHAGYLVFKIGKYRNQDSILGKIHENGKQDKKGRVNFSYHVAVYLYKIGKYLKVGTKNGAVNIDHINENKLDNRPENLRLVPTELNSMRQGSTKSGINPHGKQFEYNIPGHTMVISVKNGEKRVKACNRKFKAPFNSDNFPISLEQLGYREGTNYLDNSRTSRKAAEIRKSKQARAFLKYLRGKWKELFPQWKICDDVEGLIDELITKNYAPPKVPNMFKVSA